jgi:hypothetical protein
MERRGFLAALATLAMTQPSANLDEESPRSEVETYWAVVPPGATLWAHAVFLSDAPIEITIASVNSVQRIRGRFGGERMRAYSWRNSSDTDQRVGIRATALAGHRDLAAGPVHYTYSDHLYLAFGRRGTPENPSDRRGGYPSEAVFVGFFVFD